jgi:hypothetical protein
MLEDSTGAAVTDHQMLKQFLQSMVDHMNIGAQSNQVAKLFSFILVHKLTHLPSFKECVVHLINKLVGKTLWCGCCHNIGMVIDRQLYSKLAENFKRRRDKFAQS